ncbi:MAG: hypothetical protein U0694_23295 [Anaerolineae bacterium]
MNVGLALAYLPFALLMGINSARYGEETQATPGAHELYALPLEYGLLLGRAINEYLPEGGVVFSPVEDWVLNSLAGRSFLGCAIIVSHHSPFIRALAGFMSPTILPAGPRSLNHYLWCRLSACAMTPALRLSV